MVETRREFLKKTSLTVASALPGNGALLQIGKTLTGNPDILATARLYDELEGEIRDLNDKLLGGDIDFRITGEKDPLNDLYALTRKALQLAGHSQALLKEHPLFKDYLASRRHLALETLDVVEQDTRADTKLGAGKKAQYLEYIARLRENYTMDNANASEDSIWRMSTGRGSGEVGTKLQAIGEKRNALDTGLYKALGANTREDQYALRRLIGGVMSMPAYQNAVDSHRFDVVDTMAHMRHQLYQLLSSTRIEDIDAKPVPRGVIFSRLNDLEAKYLPELRSLAPQIIERQHAMERERNAYLAELRQHEAQRQEVERQRYKRKQAEWEQQEWEEQMQEMPSIPHIEDDMANLRDLQKKAGMEPKPRGVKKILQNKQDDSPESTKER